MKKWVEIRVTYDDGSTDLWTPEDLERMKFIGSELIEMVMRSAKKK